MKYRELAISTSEELIIGSAKYPVVTHRSLEIGGGTGMAPTVHLEQLEYDTRSFNQALKKGKHSAQILQRL